MRGGALAERIDDVIDQASDRKLVNRLQGDRFDFAGFPCASPILDRGMVMMSASLAVIRAHAALLLSV